MTKILALTLLALVGCANLERDQASSPNPPSDGSETPDGPTENPPPDAENPPLDAEDPCDGPTEPPSELDDVTKAACCHALLDGAPPKHECGYPPGLCKNGKKELFCKLADGTDAQFTLCNP